MSVTIHFTDKGERASRWPGDDAHARPHGCRRTSAITKSPSSGSPSRNSSVTSQQKAACRTLPVHADVFGENDTAPTPTHRAARDTLRALGLTKEDFVIRLSSRNAWQEFYKSKAKRNSANTTSTRS